VDRTLATDLAAILNATDPTLRMEINSGGQPSYAQGGKDGVNRVSGGTVNHDIKANGETLVVDVQIFDAKGNQLTPASHPEVFGRLAQNAVIAGFTQIGMGADKTHLGKDPADTRVRSWGYPSGNPPKLVQEGIRLGKLELERSGTSRYVKMVAAVAGNVSGPQVPVPTIRGGANVASTGVKPSAAGMLPGVGGLVNAMAGLKAAVGDNTPLVATPAINPAVYTPQSSTDDLLSSLPPVKGGKPSIDYMPVDTNAAPRSSSLDTAWGVPTPFSGKQFNQTTANPTPNPVVNASYNPGFMPKLPPGQSEAPSNFNAREYVQSTTGFDPDAAIKDSYLDVLNKAEGSPSPNTLFGYDTFDSLSTHPNTKVWYNNGEDFSTAAGLYQINKATWDEFSAKTGVTDFSEASQKTVGWAIAEANYAKNTGRDLLADLKSGNTQQIMDAFTGNSNRWASLPGGKQPTTNINDLVKDFNEGLKNRIETDFTPDASITQGGGMLGSGLGGMSRPGIDISPGSATSGGSNYNSPTAIAGGLVPGLGGFIPSTSGSSSASGTGSVASKGVTGIGSGSSSASGTGSVAANGGGSSAVKSGASAVGGGSSGSSGGSGTGSVWGNSTPSTGTKVTGSGGSSAVGSGGLGGSKPSSSSAVKSGGSAVGSGAPKASGSQKVTSATGGTITKAQSDAIRRL
jgi:muramidase (phage lysozyme)